jgi:hypothetical protein
MLPLKHILFVVCGAIAFSIFPAAAEERQLSDSPVEGEASLTLADQSGDQSGEITDRIIHLSGFTGISMQVHALANAYLKTVPGISQKKQQEVLVGLMHWAPEPLTHKLQHSLIAFNASQQKELVELLSAPMMKQARDIEASAIAMQGSKGYKSYTERLRQQVPAQPRIAMINRLDQAMGMSQWVLLARAAVASELGKQDVLFELSEEAVRAKTREYLLYAYRFTSNSDIQRIAELWQTPPLSTWTEVAYQSLISNATGASILNSTDLEEKPDH